jgi:hypothetical protein
MSNLTAVDTDRPPVVGLWQSTAIIFMRRVVPVGT